jgi:hypothetical protein
LAEHTRRRCTRRGPGPTQTLIVDIATDIHRGVDGHIAKNRHIEDDLTQL